MKVVEVRLDASEKTLHVGLSWREERGCCPKCGAEASKRKVEPRKEPVRHLDCIGHKRPLYIDALELECTVCRKPFDRKPSFMSEAVYIGAAYFEGMMKQAQATSVATTAEWNGKSGSSFAAMYHGQLKKADERRVLSPVRRLGIDETAFLRGKGD
jgi:transposase